MPIDPSMGYLAGSVQAGAAADPSKFAIDCKLAPPLRLALIENIGGGASCGLSERAPRTGLSSAPPCKFPNVNALQNLRLSEEWDTREDPRVKCAVCLI